MYCYKCGFQLKDDANFCLKCGAKNINIDSIKTEKASTYDLNNATKEIKIPSNDINATSKKINTKKPITRNVIIIGFTLTLLSIGLISYYMSLSKFSASDAKIADKTTTKTTVTPTNKTNTDSATKSDVTTSTDDTVKDKINSPDNYIFEKSGDENLVDSDVSTLSKENLALARNEIFARHGLVFQTEPFKSYFNKKSWYIQNPNFKGSSEFNDAEKYNVQLLLDYENK